MFISNYEKHDLNFVFFSDFNGDIRKLSASYVALLNFFMIHKKVKVGTKTKKKRIISNINLHSTSTYLYYRVHALWKSCFQQNFCYFSFVIT